MSDHIDGFSREAEQEVRRRATVPVQRNINFKFRLRRDDPRVQRFLDVADTVAAELDTPIALPETTKIAAVMRLLDSLRACGVPVDEILESADYVNKTRDPSAIMRTGVELIGAFGSLLGGRARDATSVLRERLQEKMEAQK